MSWCTLAADTAASASPVSYKDAVCCAPACRISWQILSRKVCHLYIFRELNDTARLSRAVSAQDSTARTPARMRSPQRHAALLRRAPAALHPNEPFEEAVHGLILHARRVPQATRSPPHLIPPWQRRSAIAPESAAVACDGAVARVPSERVRWGRVETYVEDHTSPRPGRVFVRSSRAQSLTRHTSSPTWATEVATATPST